METLHGMMKPNECSPKGFCRPVECPPLPPHHILASCERRRRLSVFRPLGLGLGSLCAQRLTSPDSGGQACFLPGRQWKCWKQGQARRLRGQGGPEFQSSLGLVSSPTWGKGVSLFLGMGIFAYLTGLLGGGISPECTVCSDPPASVSLSVKEPNVIFIAAAFQASSCFLSLSLNLLLTQTSDGDAHIHPRR